MTYNLKLARNNLFQRNRIRFFHPEATLLGLCAPKAPKTIENAKIKMENEAALLFLTWICPKVYIFVHNS
ncbi:MAG: hypothetical protein EBS09_06415 [Flavobacteriia bacterium]|jgi:hypothetical protein|nr:hypothetical protein [Flavobacteriia bacterium]